MVELCRYILIVGASVCLIGDVMSVTDEEFQVNVPYLAYLTKDIVHNSQFKCIKILGKRTYPEIKSTKTFIGKQ